MLNFDNKDPSVFYVVASFLRNCVEIGEMSQRNAGADASAALQRDEVAASIKELENMADEAQS
ncbi:hypothetical protein RA264_28225 [Pseudomonas syringae pv. tagetis]|uniref:hypothetical protein n=1 Tax=Pseudomonas syringae group genomosp. 7 TaxID=251699 RepID=UPI0037700AA9